MRAIIIFILLSLTSTHALYDRFLYATMSWSRSSLSSKAVTFYVQQAWTYDAAMLIDNATVAVSSSFQLGYGDGVSSPMEMDVVYISGNDTSGDDYIQLSATWYHTYNTNAVYRVNMTNICCLSVDIDITTLSPHPLFTPVVSMLPIYPLVSGQETAIPIPFNYVGYYTLSVIDDSTAGIAQPSSGSGYVSGRTLYWTQPSDGFYNIQLVATHSIYPGLSIPFEFTIKVSQALGVGLIAPIGLNTSEFFDGYNISGGIGETISLVVRSSTLIGYNGDLVTNQLPPNATITDCAEGSLVTSFDRRYSSTTTCTRTIIWMPPSGSVDYEIVLITRGTDSSLSSITMFRFKIIPSRPIITSVTPSNGNTNGATIVTIAGVWFGASVTSQTVKFNGSSCTIPVLNSGNILCIVPAGQGRQQPVTVTFSGRTSLPAAYNYNPPTIASLLPSGVTMSTEGGTKITLTGSNFGRWLQIVTVGGIPQTLFSSTHTNCVATLIASGGGARLPISIYVSNQTNAVVAFSLNYTRPSISGITFTQAPTLGGFTITIDGLNFGIDGNDISVNINTAISACTSVLHDTSTNVHRRLFCTAPAGTGTSKTLQVVVAGQASEPSPTFSYDPPVISGVGPPEALYPGIPFTITGYNFGATSSTGSVTVDSSVVPTVSWGESSIVLIMPPLGLQSGDNYINVITGGQSSDSLTFVTYVIPSSSASQPLPSSSAETVLLSSSATISVLSSSSTTLLSSSAEYIPSSSSVSSTGHLHSSSSSSSSSLSSSSSSSPCCISSSSSSSSSSSGGDGHIEISSSSESGEKSSSSSGIDSISSSGGELELSSSGDDNIILNSSSSSTASFANETVSHNNDGLTGGEIAGIVVGAIVGSTVIAAVVSLIVSSSTASAAAASTIALVSVTGHATDSRSDDYLVSERSRFFK